MLNETEKLDFLDAWEVLVVKPEGYTVIMEALGSLEPATRRRWLRGKREALVRARAGWMSSFPVPTSTAYDHAAINRVALTLTERGIVNIDTGYRDTRTGRKVRTLLRELARLSFADDDDLIATYEYLCEMPLDEVRRVVRGILTA